MATKCPISSEQFMREAKPIVVLINGSAITLVPTVFKTGSFGYRANAKISLEVGGVAVAFQLGANLVAVGSKEE